MKKIYIECTSTISLPFVTGIQKAVKSFLVHCPSCDETIIVLPMVIKDGKCVTFDRPDISAKGDGGSTQGVLNVFLANGVVVKLKDILKTYLPSVFVWVRRLYTNVQVSLKTKGQVVKHITFEQGDICFFPDMSWGRDVEVMACRCKRDGCFVIFYLHDLIPIRFPQYCDEIKSREFELFMRSLPLSAHAIITNSAATMHDARAWYAEQAIDVQHLVWNVAYLGVDAPTSRNVVVPVNRFERLFSSSPVFLMVSTIEPRKNHRYLLDAFDVLWKKGVDVKLVLVGRVGGGVNDLIARIEQHPLLNEKLFLLSDVGDDDLYRCYQYSTCLLFPSFAEGFGLPIIEALNVGLPVIASDIEVHKEIGGNVLMYVNPSEPSELVGLIESIANNGVDEAHQANGFTWLTWREASCALVQKIERLSAVGREGDS